jgi:prenyltransferase beta subunit
MQNLTTDTTADTVNAPVAAPAPAPGRRWTPLAVAFLSVTLALLHPADSVRAEDPPAAGEADEGEPPPDPEIDKIVLTGLEYLKSQQNEDGSWTNDIGFKLNHSYSVDSANEHHVGVTSMAAMAFLANGSTPFRGPFATQIKKALDYVISCQKPNGYITSGSNPNASTRMYSHAFATLFLAEIYGMTHANDDRDALSAAVNLIVTSQNKVGAWRYEPGSVEADMSISVCQLQALRAASYVGIHVPKSTIDNAVNYIMACVGNDGLFKYQKSDEPGARSSFALTAAGVTALHGTNRFNDELAVRGAARLMVEMRQDFRAPLKIRTANHQFEFNHFYGLYYATQAIFHSRREQWVLFIADVRAHLKATRWPNGTWKDNIGTNYATAMALLVLQIPYRYLPIFQ